MTADPTQSDRLVDEGDPGERPFPPGSILGRYVLVSVLGRGGMSIVYLAYDPDLDRRVALKLVRASRLGTQGKARLLREAQALARLSHPNVVPVYDVGTIGEQAFVAMEYVDGQTLRRWSKATRTWREVMVVMLAAGRGLAAAHEAGIVHRDFKPDNVIIGADGRVRVLDFGLARATADLDGTNSSSGSGDDASSSGDGEASWHRALASGEASLESLPSLETGSRSLEQLTRADAIIGTPAYMAPEQLRKGATDARADEFSFCVALYEALYGKRPFERGAWLSATEQPTVAERPQVTPRVLAAPAPASSKVPRRIERILSRGLAADPMHRYPSMDALLKELAYDPAAMRRRWLAIGALVLAVAGATGAMAMSSRRRPVAKAPDPCLGAAERMAQVWGPSGRAAVSAAFGALPSKYAAGAATAFVAGLDKYAAEWSAMRQDACVATRVRREQSEEVLDLRTACLDQRLVQVAALVDVMQRPDDDMVSNAAHAPELLGPVADCADVAALTGMPPQPRDPGQAARVDKLRARLADVQADYAVGKIGEAVKLSETLASDAADVGYAPLSADVQLWRGRAGADLGDATVSVPAYRQAFALAIIARNDKLLAEAAARLAQEYLYQPALEDFRYWEQVARAALARSPNQHLEMFVEQLHCVAYHWDGMVKTRLACMRAHAARLEQTQGMTEWELTMLGIAAGDAAEYEEAIGYLRRGVEFSTRANGATHPRTLEMRAYLCKGFLDVGDYTQAATECQAALTLLLANAPESVHLAARLREYLGATYAAQGRREEARTLLTLAREDEEMKGEATVELAHLLGDRGDRDAAVALARESLADDLKALPPMHPNVIVDRLALGTALLDRNEATAAVEVLAPALPAGEAGAATLAELPPLLVAQVQFAHARARWRAYPADRPAAVALARESLAAYQARAPKTEKYRAEIATIEAWIATPGR